MTEITDADREMAEILAAMICGCADARQRRGDVNQLLAYREAEVSKEVAKIVALTATLAGVLYSVVWSDYYGIKDDMMANGCEHGFKPASSCPNKNCDKGELERAIDEALRQWEEARNGF